ncbi:MAG: translation elongation factor Ts [Planctomycetota bacterium]
MSVSAQEVKELREKTGAGMMDCKKALVEADGDQEKAMTVLREKGKAEAKEKKGRSADEGIIAQYVHGNNKIGVLVELNCETDFVARNEDFQELGREIAMQVAAMDPMVVGREDMPEEVVEREREIYAKHADDKPDHVVDQIVDGKMEKFYAKSCLMEQEYIRDSEKTIQDLVDEMITVVGEKIKVARFERLEVGQGGEQDEESDQSEAE